ncbi:substrate-binding domain-containing protein [uncultured Planococcus sp.]|uniref:substrate-binding domain-containing protein n=1 Tax=uncultured Planococcus sp. TaxID=337815 RepID=UPI00344B4444
MAYYKRALTNYNITGDSKIVYNGHVSTLEIKNFLEKILNGKNPPTSLYTASDQIAMIVIDLLTEMGLKVPEDFSIVGFDNIDIAANPHINLTTISQNKQDMTKMALKNY